MSLPWQDLEALTNPSSNQASYAPRDAATKASESEHCVGKQKTRLASKDIAEFPVQRLGSRHCEEVGGSDPRDIVERVQIATNFAVDRSDNGLVQKG